MYDQLKKGDKMEKLVKLLKQNARLTNEQLGTMLGISAGEVAAQIEKLENDGIIYGYTVIIDEEKFNKDTVTAIMEIKVTPKSKYGYSDIAKTIARFSEVESVRLMSGDYDLAVTVKCANIREIGAFVAERLSPIDGVLSISTHFVIGRYKELGEEFVTDIDERGLASP
jgi:DNA-binding Lrp family transcriptional regulator